MHLGTCVSHRHCRNLWHSDYSDGPKCMALNTGRQYIERSCSPSPSQLQVMGRSVSPCPETAAVLMPWWVTAHRETAKTAKGGFCGFILSSHSISRSARRNRREKLTGTDQATLPDLHFGGSALPHCIAAKPPPGAAGGNSPSLTMPASSAPAAVGGTQAPAAAAATTGGDLCTDALAHMVALVFSPSYDDGPPRGHEAAEGQPAALLPRPARSCGRGHDADLSIEVRARALPRRGGSTAVQCSVMSN